MPLRVIAGAAKGKRLKLVPGDSTRPIMDRVKEALFSIIGTDIYDATFLDLFAGTGSVAIEALSRGAESAFLIDTERDAIKTIQDNLTLTGFSDRATIRRGDAIAFLNTVAPQPFTYIYVAPPQYKGLWLQTLKRLDDVPKWLADDGSIIVQIDPDEREPFTLKHFSLYDERKYGNTLLFFLETNPKLSESDHD
jgi:16S rRNA (guanine(966)-N(2))-methyltransferase RsmD